MWEVVWYYPTPTEINDGCSYPYIIHFIKAISSHRNCLFGTQVNPNRSFHFENKPDRLTMSEVDSLGHFIFKILHASGKSSRCISFDYFAVFASVFRSLLLHKLEFFMPHLYTTVAEKLLF